ncbi:hypothetical protein IID21_03505 [Patescibacteria group bacterium]|nr:hypothetical protein [Patescibacteria group bacterium]
MFLPKKRASSFVFALSFLVAFFLFFKSGVYAQNCIGGSCSVGFSCDFGSAAGERGPATWGCSGGSCNRPDSCPGAGACFSDGFRIAERVGCASDPGPPNPPGPTSPPGPPVPIPPSTQGEPRPRPIPFPCDKVSPNLPLRLDDEHHSLRPYQSSPCNPNLEDTALFCANDLILGDSVTVTKDQALDCTPVEPPLGGDPPTTEICTFEVDRSRSFAIDLSGADLPIAGYTEPSKGNEGRFEQVVNSNVQPDPETVDDAEKVNEYVSWYLNGVNERAEYPFLDVEKNCIGETTQKPGVCKPTILGICLEPFIVPIPTLLQSDGKSSCVGATTQCCVSPLTKPLESGEILDRDKLINYSGPIKKLLSQSSQWRTRLDQVDKAIASREKDAGIRHDQVAGCIYKIGGIALGSPIPCYGSGFDEIFKTRLRLSDWDNKRPPLEEDYQDKTFIDYLVEIRRWRGESCAVFKVPSIIPIAGGQQYFFCYDNPLKPNFWANLFPYIPFSSTEDRLGNVEVNTASLRAVSPDITLSNISIISNPADLFFAHMQEASELADILQGTYVPKGEARVGPITNVSPSDFPFCDLTQIRNNPGDDLFAGEIGVDLSYTATFDCEFEIPPQPIEEPQLCNTALFGLSCVPADWSCLIGGEVGPPLCPDVYQCGAQCSSPPPPTCTKNLNLSLGLNSNTPLADDIWSRLVAGSSSVFKRIFPKIGEGGPLVSILDIPAATKVSYSGDGLISAGNPGTQRSGESAELYFPHIGGLQEYFLECIQTTLRPQGYGKVCESGALSNALPSTDCPSVPDSAIPGEWLGGFKQNFISLANRWTASCPGPENNFADECYNAVVSESLSSGVNPAFALTIWVNETGASNYCFSGPTAQDFGINDPSIYQNFNEQLTRLLSLPFAGTYLACRSQAGWIEPMQAFLSRFQAGGCDPGNALGTGYYNHIRTFTWPLVSGGCTSGNNFAISWPTDNSCP